MPFPEGQVKITPTTSGGTPLFDYRQKVQWMLPRFSLTLDDRSGESFERESVWIFVSIM
jgi:hypothetical protein